MSGVRCTELGASTVPGYESALRIQIQKAYRYPTVFYYPCIVPCADRIGSEFVSMFSLFDSGFEVDILTYLCYWVFEKPEAVSDSKKAFQHLKTTSPSISWN